MISKADSASIFVLFNIFNKNSNINLVRRLHQVRAESQSRMKNEYYKYLCVSEEDANWGLYVLYVGYTSVAAHAQYPQEYYPSHHYFTWKSGRILDEYQILYITRGEGYFESDSYKQKITAGTIIILFPGEKHRYIPDPDIGWDEYWIGIRGSIIDNHVHHKFFNRENPCINIGVNEKVVDLFNLIIDKTRGKNKEDQPMMSGVALHLLGILYYMVKQKSQESEQKDLIMNQARDLFNSNVSKDFSPKMAAEQLKIGYSLFRKLFKNYTGLSPGQYFIQVKIEKAKNLLENQSLSIKEIAYDLKFDSCFYFSKLFKQKTGMSPTIYRKKSATC